ncbi:MAG: hypothetical protein GXW96_11430 [Christensenellaceae bacterium]|nr:hypothetical protein [Christensenellaceae bacterium]
MQLINADTGKTYTQYWPGATASFTVPSGNYVVSAVKGGMKYTSEARYFSGSAEFTIPVTTLTVNFPGVSVNRATISVGGAAVETKEWVSDSAVFKLFKGQTYDILVQKGGMSHRGSVTCGDNDKELTYDVPVRTLTIKFDGIKADRTAISVGGAEVAIQDWVSNTVSYKVFGGTTYTVLVKKGGMSYQADVEVGEADVTHEVPVRTLTINFPGVSVSRTAISVGGAEVATQDWVSNTVSYKVFPNTTYTILAKKNSMVHSAEVEVKEDDVTYDIPICHVVAQFPGLKASRAVIGYTDDVTVKDWQNDSVEFYVFQGNPYYVNITIDGKTYSYNPVDCRTDEVVLGNATLTVNYPGVKSVNRVTLTDSKGKNYSKDWTSDSSTFNVPNGLYKIKAIKGGMVYEAKDVVVVGGMIYDIDLITISVNYPGVKSVNRVLLAQDGATVETHDWTSDSTSFTAFNNGKDYTITLTKGGMTYTGTVTCSNPLLDVPLIELKVNYPGVKSVNCVLVAQNGTTVVTHDWTSDGTSFVLFNNGTNYTVTLTKGGMTYTGTVTCDNPVLNVPLTNLQILYPGLKSVNRVQILANSQNVDTRDWTSDSASFYLFQSENPYSIVINKGSDKYTYASVLCNAPSVVVDKAGVMLNTGGVKADYVQFKQNGSVKYTFYNVASGQKLTVLNGIYDITIVKSSMSTQLKGVVCLGDAAEKDVSTKTLTFSFPGIKADYVQLKRNGAVVYTVYNPQEEAKFIVFDNGVAYTASVIKGSISQPYTIS